jgi:hypothetical protein
MRSDRGTTFATILVVLCCLGGTASAGSYVTHRVIIASVVSSCTTVVVKPGSHSYMPSVESIGLTPFVVTIHRIQNDIIDHHNLPPPTV